jgi:predicted RNase H-like HicB family nuclease
MRYSVLIHSNPALDVFVATVPLLEIGTQADTLDEALARVRSLIQFHIEGLIEDGEDVPVEDQPFALFPVDVEMPMAVGS